jgi:hypothetical protein
MGPVAMLFLADGEKLHVQGDAESVASQLSEASRFAALKLDPDGKVIYVRADSVKRIEDFDPNAGRPFQVL